MFMVGHIGQHTAMNITAGTELTCDRGDCDCKLVVEKPCPHGDDYMCGCGHPLTPIDRDAPVVTPGA